MPRTIAINRMPVVAWVFMLIWLGMLALFTGLAARDGGTRQFDPPLERAILGVFWFVGAAASAHLLGKPVVVLARDGAQLQIRHVWLWGARRVWRGEVGAPPTVVVVQTQDTEGDPYFEVQLAPPGLPPFVLFEGHDRSACEAAQARILAQLAAP